MRTAVVLGASSGIGLACAESLAKCGVFVVMAARRKDSLEAEADRLRSAGLSVEPIRADITDADELDSVFSRADEQGGCDILVNNNGGPPGGSLLTLDDAAWQEGFTSYAMPVFRAIRRVVPKMKEKGWGRIITIASVSVKQPIPGLDISNFVRAGLGAVNKTLSRELAADGINVHLVCPGNVATERSRGRIQARADKEGVSFETAVAASAASIPLGRLAEPDEIADIVAFLSSDKASFLTGNIIQVDGGLTTGIP